MAEQDQIEQKLMHMAFIQRESGFAHHPYEKEMLQYEYVRNGDMRAVEVGIENFRGRGVGCVSKNPLNNRKYLYVASVTLATRAAIEGGLEQETAYNLSDLMIQKVDECKDEEEIFELCKHMLAEFVQRVSAHRQVCKYTRLVLAALDYIYIHLQEQFTVDDVAQAVGLSRSYLSVLFKREVCMSVSDYVRSKRIEAAENMLKFSDFSLQDISDYLAFNSQSHFISVFRQHTGMTPGVYRKKYYMPQGIIPTGTAAEAAAQG